MSPPFGTLPWGQATCADNLGVLKQGLFGRFSQLSIPPSVAFRSHGTNPDKMSDVQKWWLNLVSPFVRISVQTLLKVTSYEALGASCKVDQRLETSAFFSFFDNLKKQHIRSAVVSLWLILSAASYGRGARLQHSRLV